MSLTDQQKEVVQKLWTDNFLNLKEATRLAMNRQTKTVYIAVSHDGVIAKPGSYEPYPFAVEALQTMTRSKNIKWFLWTYHAERHYNYFVKNLFIPNGIQHDFFNENPDMMNLEQDPRKPHYDSLFDDCAGFKTENTWFWINELLKSMDLMLPDPQPVTNTFNGLATPPIAHPVARPVAQPITNSVRVDKSKYQCQPDQELKTTSRIRRSVTGRTPDQRYDRNTGTWK